MRKVIALVLLLLPWPLRRRALIAIFHYRIHPTARIGLSLILPQELEMEEGSRIGSLSLCKGLKLVRMKRKSSIGNLNWITGFPAGDTTYFASDVDRRPELILGEHAAITNRHFLDCTNAVHIGSFTTIAGYRSQILTHSIDLYKNLQSSKPITIGDYCFVGTASIFLGNSVLPDFCVLGAGSVLNKAYTDQYFLYAGSPARPVKALTREMGYFQRTTGHVY